MMINAGINMIRRNFVETGDRPTLRLSAADRESVWRVALVEDFLNIIDEQNKDRIKLIPRGKQMLHAALGLFEKFYSQYLLTIPFDQMASVQRQMGNITYSVGVTSAQGRYRDKGYGLFLSNQQFVTMLGACRDHCIVCDKDKQQQRQCELKKVLDSLPITRDTFDSNGNCVYFDILMAEGK